MVRAGDIIMYRRERIEAINVRINKLRGGLLLAERMSAFWIKQKERWAPLVNTRGKVVYQDEEGKGKTFLFRHSFDLSKSLFFLSSFQFTFGVIAKVTPRL